MARSFAAVNMIRPAPGPTYRAVHPGSKLIEQMLAAAKADIATQVGRNWVLALIQHMQEGQRGFQAQTGPGCVVAHSWSRGGTVDTGNYLGHRCSPSQWPMS